MRRRPPKPDIVAGETVTSINPLIFVLGAGLSVGLFLWTIGWIGSGLLALASGLAGALLVWLVGTLWLLMSTRADAVEGLSAEACTFWPFLWYLTSPLLLVWPWFSGLFGAGQIVAFGLFIGLNVLLRARPSDAQPRSPTASLDVPLLIVLYVAVMACLGLLQYRAVNVCYSDTGLIDEVMWNTLHGRWWHTNSLPAVAGRIANYDHVAPILLLLLPFYALWPGVPFLILTQTLLLALGAVPLYRLALDALRNHRAALALVAAYLLYTPLQTANSDGGYNLFRPVVLAIPFLLGALYFLERSDGVPKRNRVWFVAFTLLALMCGEEIAVVVAALGVYVFLAKRWRVLGATLALLGVTWVLVSLYVIIPCLRGSAPLFLGSYEHLGSTPLGVAGGALAHPDRALAAILTAPKVEYVLQLLVPLGFLSLLAPSALLIALPTLAYNLLSSKEAQFSVLFYYSAPAIPFVFASAIYGLAKVMGTGETGTRMNADDADNARMTAPTSHFALIPALCAFVLTCSVVSHVFFAKSPISVFFWRSPRYGYHLYQGAGEKMAVVAKLKALVPQDASLCATQFIGAHFAHQRDFHLFPDRWRDADYVLLGLSERWLPKEAVSECLDSLEASDHHVVLFKESGFALFGKKR